MGVFHIPTKNNNENKILVPVKVCPECNSHLFKTDDSTKEMYCLLCGLTIHAPYSTDFIRPDFKIVNIVLNITENVEIKTRMEIKQEYIQKQKEKNQKIKK